ncbi:MAG TPA: DUF2336 domain-containing protein [Sphingomicrobium sp.]|nr:DUF2336 domain-containing protein [Sphingomicrobium sp.]
MVPDEWPIASPSEDDGGYPARPAGRRRLPTVRKDFFLDPRDRLTEQERALMTAMLAELLGTIAEEIRASLPMGFAAANDEDSQQLLRGLSDAGLLDDLGLIALLLRRADEERIANAIRARSNPRGGFLQALIADEDELISASAMALILARGRRRNRLGQPRIEFEDLPPDLANTLAYAVAAWLRKHAPGLASKEGHIPFGRAAASLLQSRDDAKAIDGLTVALVRTLNEAGLLDERLLESAADEGDVAFLAYALGDRAGIGGASAWDYLADGNDGRLVLLLRLAGVSRDFAARQLALLGDLVGIVDLGAEIGRFDALDEGRARSVSEWLQLDPGYRMALRTLGSDNGDRAL